MANSSEFENRMAQRRSRREKKQKRNWVIKGVAAAFLLYLIVSVVLSFRNGVTTTIAMKGTVQEEIVTDGYIFRQQSVIDAPISGYLECLVDDGERVKEGQKVGVIHTGEYDPDRTGKIRDLTDRIARLEGSPDETILTGDGVVTEKKISLLARDLSDRRQEHDMGILAEEKENLDLLIEQKNATEQGESINKETLLTDLKRQLHELQATEEGGSKEIYAGISGVFCSRIDGMEDTLTLEAASEMTVGQLEELDRKPLERKESVSAGEPVCKIVDNYGWSYVTGIPEEDAKKLEVGSVIRFRFLELSDTTIYGKVQQMSEPENGKVAVTVSTNRFVDGIYGVSRASAEVVIVSVEGIKVPVESLHVLEGQPGVYVLRLGVARFVPVNVKYRNDTWAVIGAVTDTGAEYQLKIYDEVIVNAKNLEDGKVVR